MRIDRTTVAGNGVLHHIVPRRGGRLGLLVDADNTRHLFTYEESDLDVPAQAILLEPEGAGLTSRRQSARRTARRERCIPFSATYTLRLAA